MDGGRVAARGFLYQYLRTAEAVLIALTTDDRVHACRVEGDPYPTELGSTDIVDFDLIDRDGTVLRSVQVKSGAPGAQLSAGDVFTILVRLTARAEAERVRAADQHEHQRRRGRTRAAPGPRPAACRAPGRPEVSSARSRRGGILRA